MGLLLLPLLLLGEIVEPDSCLHGPEDGRGDGPAVEAELILSSQEYSSA